MRGTSGRRWRTTAHDRLYWAVTKDSDFLAADDMAAQQQGRGGCRELCAASDAKLALCYDAALALGATAFLVPVRASAARAQARAHVWTGSSVWSATRVRPMASRRRRGGGACIVRRAAARSAAHRPSGRRATAYSLFKASPTSASSLPDGSRATASAGHAREPVVIYDAGCTRTMHDAGRVHRSERRVCRRRCVVAVERGERARDLLLGVFGARAGHRCRGSIIAGPAGRERRPSAASLRRKGGRRLQTRKQHRTSVAAAARQAPLRRSLGQPPALRQHPAGQPCALAISCGRRQPSRWDRRSCAEEVRCVIDPLPCCAAVSTAAATCRLPQLGGGIPARSTCSPASVRAAAA